MEQTTPPKRFFYTIYLLASVFILLVLYSFTQSELSIGSITIKRNKSYEFFYRDSLLTGVIADSVVREKKEEIDSSAQRFLFIGDSMLEFLRIRLNDYCRENGHTMNTVIWYSSSTLWYGSCDTIAYFIKKFEPTYVLLAIGSNELFIKDIISERDQYVDNILSQVGDLKYLWIGPPNWKDDTGINDLIVRNVGRKRYYPSKNLTFKRGKDGAHPVRESGYMWMDSIARFIMYESQYRVLMNAPDTFLSKVPPTVIISPNPPN